MISRKELTGRLQSLAVRIERHGKSQRGRSIDAVVPQLVLRSWTQELRRLEASIHALPNLRPIEGSFWE